MSKPAAELLQRAAGAAYRRIEDDRQKAGEESGRILGFLRRHLFDPRLDVNWILRNLKMSHNASSRFRAEMGIGPKRYSEARRLETAGRLLRGTDLEVREVGELVGYRRFAAFSHAFDLRLGCRPKVYRDSRGPMSLPSATAEPSAEVATPGVPRFLAGTSLAADARCARCGAGLVAESAARVFEDLKPICDLCAHERAPRELVDFLFLNAPHRKEAARKRRR